MDQYIQYIPLIFTGLFFLSLVVGALIGLVQGLYKSLYYMLFTLVILVGGFFLIPVIANKLLDVNLSFLNDYLSSSLGVNITTLRETVPTVLIDKFPEMAHLFVEGSDVLALVYGLIKFVLTIVLFIVLLFLNWTVFKLIAFIIWLIIRPKRDKDKEQMGIKRKKYRLFGALSGAARGFIILFIMAVPLAGVFSIGENAVELMPLVEGTGGQSGTSNDLDILTDVINSYRKSVMGKVYGFPTAGERFDEKIFDGIFKIDVDSEDEKNRIKLRQEINSLVNIINVILEKNDYQLEFDVSLLFKFTEEDIAEINKNLKNINLINIIKNIGLEYLYYELINDKVDPNYEDYLQLAKMKEDLDLKEDLTKIMEAIGVITTSDAKELIFENIFALTADEAVEIFELLGETELIKMGLTIGVNGLLMSGYIDELIEGFNLDKDLIYRPTPEELVEDFINIVEIYELAYDIGFTTNDDVMNILDNINMIEDRHIEDLLTTVFDFTLLYRNDDLFATIVYDQVVFRLPEEFQEYITQQKIKANFNAAELSHLAIIGKMLLEEGVLEGNIDYETLFSEEKIEKFAHHIAYSDLLSGGIEQFLNIFINEDTVGFNIEMPEGMSFKNEPGKLEIISLLNAARELLSIDFDGGVDAFNDLSDEKIGSIAGYLSGSSIITYNLKGIIDSVFKEVDAGGIKITIPDFDDHQEFWSKTEIESLFLAIKDVAKLTEGLDSFKELSDDDINDFSKHFTDSKVILSNLSTMIDTVTENSETDFGFKIVQPVGLFDENPKAELAGIFKSFRAIARTNLTDGSGIADLDDDDIEDLSESFTSSKLIKSNLTSIIESIGDEDTFSFKIEIDDDSDDYWTKDELKYTLTAASVFAKKGLSSSDIYKLSQEELDPVVRSFTISNAIKNMLITETEVGGSLHNTLLLPQEEVVWATVGDQKGELELFFNNINLLLGDGDDLESLNLNLSTLKTMDLAEMFKSRIVETTAVELHIKPLVEDTLDKYLVSEYKDGTAFEWYLGNNATSDTIELINGAIKLDESGLDIESLDYTVFKSSSDNSAQTISMNDAFIGSNILKASLHKMLNEMLVEDQSIVDKVNNPDDLDYWGKLSAEDEENRGELFALLNALSVGDGFKDSDFDTLDEVAAEGFKAEIKKISASETLRPVLADMLEEDPLIKLNDYRVKDDEPGYVNPKELTEEEWNNEINTLVDIMVILNEGFDPKNFNPLNPNDLAGLQKLQVKMDESKLYDTQKLYDEIGYTP